VTPPVLVDSHAHVAEPEFEADRAAVLARAAAAGVTTIVCVGATGGVDTNAPAVALAGEQDGVRIVASVGIHPHDAVTADDAAFETLRGLAGRPGVVALGETGLDYHYDHSPRPVQLGAFARTAALARALDLPLVVHVRDAHADAVGVLRGERLGPAGGVIHCFTGGAGDVGPYLAPVPNRGKRNEHAHVRLVAEALARLRGEPLDVLAAATTANALRLFRLAHKGT